MIKNKKHFLFLSNLILFLNYTFPQSVRAQFSPSAITTSSSTPLLVSPDTVISPRSQIMFPSTPSPVMVSEETNSVDFLVTQFEFQGNTVFSEAELDTVIIPKPESTIGSITPDAPGYFSFFQLLEIATQVANYYAQKGYRTSGAIIVIPEETQTQKKGSVVIKIIEGKLEAIEVGLEAENKSGRLDNYIRDRLKVGLDSPLNVDRLLEALQLLQIDPLITNISAQLSAGTETGKNRLVVSYREANPFSIPFLVNNARSPSVGSFQRGAGLKHSNLFGLGDEIRVGYLNTDGSDRIKVSYEVPFNPDNGKVRLEYLYNDSKVIEPPFDDIDGDGNRGDITSNYEGYNLSLNQPIIRSIDNDSNRLTEFSLGLTASWQDTQSFLFGEPFPFALSADILGNTRVFALRFSQNFTQQNNREIWALRSQFNLGLDAFGSTVNATPTGVEIIPDSRFFNWRFQGQYVNLLAKNTPLLVRTNLQLSDRPLLPIEQFYTGGLGSVLGYRQDQLLTDSGFFLGTEVRFPLVQAAKGDGVLQIIPFVHYGIGWNVEGASPDPNNLASVGLGLLWRSGKFSARLDWGIPLIDVDNRRRTWQENGIYFNIQYDSF